MSNDLVILARERKFKHRTHYQGCEAVHFECLVGKLADEVERLKALIICLSRPCEGDSALVLEDKERDAIATIWREKRLREAHKAAAKGGAA